MSVECGKQIQGIRVGYDFVINAIWASAASQFYRYYCDDLSFARLMLDVTECRRYYHLHRPRRWMPPETEAEIRFFCQTELDLQRS